MHLTYYGANSWLWDLGDYRVLIDPWLVDSLVFGNLTWLFKGNHVTPIDLPRDIDLILLSQGLPDHTHRPTLQRLDRHIPVVGSANAAAVVKDLGYRDVTAIAPGDVYQNERLSVVAFRGAPVGITPENGYLMTALPSDTTTRISVYYEPHGYPPPNLETHIASQGPVDIVISPVVNLELPLAGAIIQGQKTALTLAEALRPRLFFPTAAGGDITYSGILDTVLNTQGSVDAFRRTLADRHIATDVVEPVPQQPVSVAA